MDTSETYIKMCEKAEEIQEDWFPKHGDWCRSPQGVIELVTKSAVEVDTPNSRSKPEYVTIGTTFGKGGEMTASNIRWSSHFSLRQYLWLPRQDQLQEMVNGNINFTLALSGFAGVIDVLKVYPFSWEQLWLQLIMLLKYNKVWDGEKWTLRI